MPRVASPLDGCGGFEVMLELMLGHQQLGPGELFQRMGRNIVGRFEL